MKGWDKRVIKPDPFPAKIYICKTKQEYTATIKAVLGEDLTIDKGVAGRINYGNALDEWWSCVIWGKTMDDYAHELSHAIFLLFDRHGLSPSDSGGEFFCYMLSSLLAKSRNVLKIKVR